MEREARIVAKQFVFTGQPLESDTDVWNIQAEFLDGSVTATTDVYGERDYAEWRRSIGRAIGGAASPINYIYRIRKPLRIFEMTPKDISFCIEREVLDPKVLERLFPGLDHEQVVRAVQKEFRGGRKLLKACHMKPFMAYFDGWEDAPKMPNRQYGIWQSVAEKAVLVDGNAPRFVEEAPQDVGEVPEQVLADLEAYTSFEGRTIPADTRKWLKDNIPLPYSSIKVYRGVQLIAASEEDLWRDAREFFGVSLLELRRGTTVTLRRGQESSWSKTPQIAQEFAKASHVGVLVQATLNAGDIVADLTLLPLKYRRRFAHYNQNEVIAAKGAIRGKIMYVSADPYEVKGGRLFKTVKFEPRVGIVPKTAAARVLARVLDVPEVKQSPAMCGPAALRAVMLYWGKDVSEDELASRANWNYAEGTPPEGLVKAAQAFGFRAWTWEEAKIGDLRRLVGQGAPIIVDWFSVDEGHYSVVIGFEPDGVRLMDPQYGLDRTIETTSFIRRWFDFDGSTTEHKGLTRKRVVLVLPPE